MEVEKKEEIGCERGMLEKKRGRGREGEFEGRREEMRDDGRRE